MAKQVRFQTFCDWHCSIITSNHRPPKLEDRPRCEWDFPSERLGVVPEPFRSMLIAKLEDVCTIFAVFKPESSLNLLLEV